MAQGPQNRKMQSIIGISQMNHLKDQQEREEEKMRKWIKGKLEENKVVKGTEGDSEMLKEYQIRMNRKRDEVRKEQQENNLVNLIDLENKGLQQMLVEPQKLSPLLQVLEQENVVLKGEVTTLSQDLTRFMEWVQLLMEENKFMREHINKKNADITNIIQTIGLNDSQQE